MSEKVTGQHCPGHDGNHIRKNVIPLLEKTWAEKKKHFLF
jgi:hypothetical protein